MDRDENEVIAPANDLAPVAPLQSTTRSSGPLVTAWVRDIIISLVISILFIIFLYQPVKVEGTSMMPTLGRPGTRLHQ